MGFVSSFNLEMICAIFFSFKVRLLYDDHKPMSIEQNNKL